jgi:hypothetical protein
MAVYVVHPGGIWSTKDWQIRELAIIGLFEALSVHLDSKYAKIINRVLRWKYLWVSEEYEKMDNISEARTYIIKSILKHLIIISRPYHNKIDTDLALAMPRYIKSESSIKLFKGLLRLSVIPVLKKFGTTILKPHSPKFYEFLRAKIAVIFKI